MDIKACDAWQITTGSNDITLGVIDGGITPDHPDFPGGTRLNLYDVPTTTIGVNQLYGVRYHGTACSGIMVAQQNNIGISGVSPDCNLLSISIDFASGNFSQQCADAIDYARLNGADIVNMSLGTNASPLIDDAIFDALSIGRDGLGMVLVISTGNADANTIAYPAKADSNVIAVGATSICWERKYSSVTPSICNAGDDDWGSNYGDELDIIAPGLKIMTLDTQTTGPAGGRYRSTFNGTSSAAPQVAATAGLLLSLYPCLTQYEVGKFIDEAAGKLSPGVYSYTTSSAHPFGLWHEEVGYGLLNAAAALEKVQQLDFLQDATLTGIERRASFTSVKAGYNVTSLKTTGNYTVASTGSLEAKAQNFISFEPGFEVLPGGVMYAHIEQFTGDCTDWVPILNKTNNLSENSQLLTSVKEVDQYTGESAINIHPNPFTNSFSVELNTTVDNQSVSISVYDLVGRLIYTHVAKELAGTHRYEVGVESACSLYIANVCIGSNCKSQKVIRYGNN